MPIMWANKITGDDKWYIKQLNIKRHVLWCNTCICTASIYIEYTELHCCFKQQCIINVTGCKNKAERGNGGGSEEWKNT